MAYTKTWPIKSTLNIALDYIMNPDKTDGKLLVSSFGCSAETASIEFAFTRKRAVMDKGDNIARHMIQSFAAGEVGADTAHEIGRKWADEVLGGKHEYVIATHTDKDTIHNHIIFNAVNFHDYHKYNSNRRSYRQMRENSDQLCKEYGLSVILQNKEKKKGYKIYSQINKPATYKDMLIAAIDNNILISASYQEFINKMTESGFEVADTGKYLRFRAEDQERFTRCTVKKMGADYTRERIQQRISGRHKDINSMLLQGDTSINMIINIEESIKAQTSIGYRQWAEKNNLQEIIKSYEFLRANNLLEYGQIESEITSLEDTFQHVKTELKSVEKDISEVALLNKHAEIYRAYKGIYDKYKQTGYTEKFYRKYERELILFGATKEYFNEHGITRLPTRKQMKKKETDLRNKKDRLYKDFKDIRENMKKLTTVKSNIEKYLQPQHVSTMIKPDQSR